MTDNPYSPIQAETPVTVQRPLLVLCMFWLTAILGVVVAGNTTLTAYHNLSFAAQNGGLLPPYIIASTLVTAVCTLALFLSAGLWRAGRVRVAFATLAASGFAFFGGPPLLLRAFTTLTVHSL